jgi:hypothetical protein
MMFLKVPFAEKDEAKALGARWNSERKSWYVPEGKAAEPFERWLAGADFLPAKAAGSVKAKPASVDSYVGKSVVGKLYAELPHVCNPFQSCTECGPALAASGWLAAHDAVAQTLTALSTLR